MAVTAAAPADISRVSTYWRRFTMWVSRNIDRGIAAGRRVWAWTRTKASSIWAWSRIKGASALAMSKRLFWRGAGYVLAAGHWAWNMVVAGVGYIGATAAWIAGGGVALAGAAFGLLGMGGLLLVLGISMLLMAGSTVIRDYVKAPFNWLRRSRKDNRGLREFVEDAREERLVEEEVAAQETPTVQTEIISGHIFKLNADLTDDVNKDGALTVLPVSRDRATPAELKEMDTYPILTLMLARGIRLPVIFDWSEVLYNDTVDVFATLDHLSKEAATKREKSYWDGRKEAFGIFGSADEGLTGSDVQKAWALNAQRHRGAQEPHNPRYLKAGFTDMSNEIQRAQQRLAEKELINN